MTAYLKAKGVTPAQVKRHLRQLEAARTVLSPTKPMELVERGESLSFLEHSALDPELLQADLAWHVRAWGRWVLVEARKDLARFYPTYAEFCALKPYRRVPLDTSQPLKLVPVDDAGAPQVDLMNTGFDASYLDNPASPRWVAKPTVAYLWARAVRCKACRAEIPLLKTRWLAKTEKKRVALKMHPREDKSGVEFGIEQEVKAQGGNAAQKREHDKRCGAGTMSRAGATCPCCGTIMTSIDIRLEGQAGRLGQVMTAVVVDGLEGNEYRLPTSEELLAVDVAGREVSSLFESVPFGLPTEPIPTGASRQGGGSPFTTPLYGIDQWHKLFTHRQITSIARLLLTIRGLRDVTERRRRRASVCVRTDCRAGARVVDEDRTEIGSARHFDPVHRAVRVVPVTSSD